MFKELTATITRPAADTTQYAAGDVLGNASSQILTFSNVSTNFVFGKGVVIAASLLVSTAPATLPSTELWLFKNAPAAAADNTAWAVTDAELLDLIGIYPMATTYVGLASGNHVQMSAPRVFAFELPSGKDEMYGVIVMRNTYTPVASEVWKVKLSISD
jgi:hypothetical protein